MPNVYISITAHFTCLSRRTHMPIDQSTKPQCTMKPLYAFQIIITCIFSSLEGRNIHARRQRSFLSSSLFSPALDQDGVRNNAIASHHLGDRRVSSLGPLILQCLSSSQRLWTLTDLSLRRNIQSAQEAATATAAAEAAAAAPPPPPPTTTTTTTMTTDRVAVEEDTGEGLDALLDE